MLDMFSLLTSWPLLVRTALLDRSIKLFATCFNLSCSHQASTRQSRLCRRFVEPRTR